MISILKILNLSILYIGKITVDYGGEYREGKIDKKTLLVERFLQPLRPIGITDRYFVLQLNEDFLEKTTHQKELISYATEVSEYLYPKYTLHILSNGFKEVQYKEMINFQFIELF